MLTYTVNLSRLSLEVYEIILKNLSTFIIYISEHQTLDDSKSSFFLNHK